MSEWISVKDRLPELRDDQYPSKDVLVVVNDEHKSMYVAYYTTYGEWEVQETGCGCCSKDIKPTHWMSLPKPPENT